MRHQISRSTTIPARVNVIPVHFFQMKNAHWFVVGLLAVFLVPAFHAANLPLHFAWANYFYTFYWSLFFQSLVAAILLFGIGYPSEFWRAITGKSGPHVNPTKAFLSVFLPATYMFFVFVLVFAYNDIIATYRFDGITDAALNRVDGWLMGGWTVADFSHNVSTSGFRWLEAIYFGMFPQVGACLVILALRRGFARAMQFSGTIASAYLMSLALFYLLPATGPYYLSVIHHDGGYVDAGEVHFVHMLNSMKEHRALSIIGPDYFIGFPCMHLVQPLIVLWFLRESKRIVTFLAAFDLVLIPAILLLQQHYVVDLVGGACVALLSIAIVDWSNLSTREPL